MENSARPETWARDTGAGSRYAAAGINIINIRQLSHCNDFIAVQCNYKTIYDVITKKNFDMKFNLRFVSQRTWPANLKLKFIHLYTQLTKLQLHASLLYIAAIETTTDLPCTVATSNICRNWSVPRLRKWPNLGQHAILLATVTVKLGGAAQSRKVIIHSLRHRTNPDLKRLTTQTSNIILWRCRIFHYFNVNASPSHIDTSAITRNHVTLHINIKVVTTREEPDVYVIPVYNYWLTEQKFQRTT